MIAAKRRVRAARDRTYYNQEFQTHAIKLMLGEYRVSVDPSIMMMTTLGSCVAACVRDPVAGVGGMNHFLLPEVPVSDTGMLGAAERYGSVAMERLINGILAAGGERERLEVKVFGGARVIDSSLDVGGRNACFVLDYLTREGLRLVGRDLGGDRPRRVHWFPGTGRALRRFISSEFSSETLREERDFRQALATQAFEGEVELFDRD